MEGAQRSDTIGRAVLLDPTVAISRLSVARLWRVHSASRLCTTVQSALRRSPTTTIRAPAVVAACVLAAWTLAATIPTQTAAEGPVGTWGATDPSEAAGRGDVVPERYGARCSRPPLRRLRC
jgi:hypothetical protein